MWPLPLLCEGGTRPLLAASRVTMGDQTVTLSVEKKSCFGLRKKHTTLL